MRDRRRANARGHVFPVHAHVQPAIRLRQIDARGARQFLEPSGRIERDAVAQRFPGHGAIHRAAIQIGVAEQIGDAFGDAALAGAYRSIDGDDELIHRWLT